MNLKEWADAQDISLKEAKKQTGLTHWKQTMPESCDEIAEETAVEFITEIANEVIDVIETESKQDYDGEIELELIGLSIRGAGSKSPYWHLRNLIGRD